MQRKAKNDKSQNMGNMLEVAHLLMKITSLEEHLEKLHEHNHNLDVRNQHLERVQLEEEHTKEEIYSFLQKQLDGQLETIAKQQLQLENMAVAASEKEKAHRAEMEATCGKYQEELTQKNIELSEANELLEALKQFREERDAVNEETTLLKEELTKQKAMHEEDVARLEMDIVQEKERLKRRMLVRIKETKVNLLKMTEGQLLNTTQRTICEYDQMVSELDYQSQETERIVKESMEVREENSKLKRELQVLQQNLNIVIKKNKKLFNETNERRETRKAHGECSTAVDIPRFIEPASLLHKDSTTNTSQSIKSGDEEDCFVTSKQQESGSESKDTETEPCLKPTTDVVGSKLQPSNIQQNPNREQGTQTSWSCLHARKAPHPSALDEATRLSEAHEQSTRTSADSANGAKKPVRLNFINTGKVEEERGLLGAKARKEQTLARNVAKKGSAVMQAEFLAEFTRHLWRATADIESSKVLFTDENTKVPRVQQLNAFQSDTAAFMQELVDFVARCAPVCLLGSIQRAKLHCTNSTMLAGQMGGIQDLENEFTGLLQDVSKSPTAFQRAAGQDPDLCSLDTHGQIGSLGTSPANQEAPDVHSLEIQGQSSFQLSTRSDSGIAAEAHHGEEPKKGRGTKQGSLPPAGQARNWDQQLLGFRVVGENTSRAMPPVFGPVRPWGKRLHSLPLGAHRRPVASRECTPAMQQDEEQEPKGPRSNCKSGGMMRPASRIMSANSQNSGSFLRKHSRYFQKMNLT